METRATSESNRGAKSGSITKSRKPSAICCAGPGGIRRLTVAVLVDGEAVTAADGTTTWQPRSEEELAILQELVASAAGLDEAARRCADAEIPAIQPGSACWEQRRRPVLLPQHSGRSTSCWRFRSACWHWSPSFLGCLSSGRSLHPGNALRPHCRSERRPWPYPERLASTGITGEIDDDFAMSDLPMVGRIDPVGLAPSGRSSHPPASADRGTAKRIGRDPARMAGA